MMTWAREDAFASLWLMARQPPSTAAIESLFIMRSPSEFPFEPAL